MQNSLLSSHSAIGIPCREMPGVPATRDIPHLFQRLRRNVGVGARLGHIFANAVNVATSYHIQQFVTLGINLTALIVRHIITFQQLLTNIRSCVFYFTLRVSDSFRHPRVPTASPGFYPQLNASYRRHRRRNTHQRTFRRQVETEEPGSPRDRTHHAAGCRYGGIHGASVPRYGDRRQPEPRHGVPASPL